MIVDDGYMPMINEYDEIRLDKVLWDMKVGFLFLSDFESASLHYFQTVFLLSAI
jgi:hypothetical protein